MDSNPGNQGEQVTGKIMDIRFRKWLYSAGIALAAVFVMYGIITAEQAVVWIALLAALLGITAIANVGENGTEKTQL